MAFSDQTASSATFALKSYETALCIIPPTSGCMHINQLRELYDKGFGRWPAHINLIYPFVEPEKLSRARESIANHFAANTTGLRLIQLGEAGHFKHWNYSTVFLRELQDQSESPLQSIRTNALLALGLPQDPANLHLTIGQTEDETDSAREFLLAKVRLLPRLHFCVGALAILIREKGSSGGTSSMGRMRLWNIIDLDSSNTTYKPSRPEDWLRIAPLRVVTDTNEADDDTLQSFSREVQPGTTFRFDDAEQNWKPHENTTVMRTKTASINISTYNVLIDSEYPPARARDPLLVRTMLSDAASSDILLLQEVSDDFLSFLLGDEEVRRRYPFTSHGPPSQQELGPLPSLRNIVLLSSFPFSWNMVPFHRRHKGALIAKFEDVTNAATPGAQDLVVAGVHLTCGLTDGSVAAKKIQLANLTNYLTQHHAAQPWVIAGDFNITTSTHTLDMAVKNKSISSQTMAMLSNMERRLSDLGLLDAWILTSAWPATSANGDANQNALFSGEEGATFDPGNNELAAAISSSASNRPQRYDRILVRPQDTLQITQFNYFGLPNETKDTQVASDHTGIRATVKMLDVIPDEAILDVETMSTYTVHRKEASKSMSNTVELTEALTSRLMLTTPEESQQRRQVFNLLKRVILGTSNNEQVQSSDIPMVFVTVGSYALGVWTRASDIDCLCIGAISSKTFFKLARQRILKDESRSIRILRKVEANTGTMLELSVNGIAIDLQYCPASRVVERWSEFRSLPASDPVFNLSVLSLRKLKPYRDMLYVQRTMPSMSTFDLAYRCIKLWAQRQGIYSSKFGYLSGTHITIMLSWVYKRMAHETGSVSVVDLMATFFDHFGNFDWSNDMVFDAFFHKKKPRYHRSAKEPMVILGHHTPNSNIAHTATGPGLRTVVKELKIAQHMVQQPEMKWDRFFGNPSDGVTQFICKHQSFAKVDIQFWGRTLSKGKSLVGWVESRCLGLVVDIDRMLPELDVRIWPARFTDREIDTNNDGADYHGCYLVGLAKNPDAKTATDKDARQLMRQSLDKVLDRFLTQLKTDEKNYDPNVCWIGVSLAKQSDVKHMRLDDREWGDYAPEMEPDSDDEEDTIEDSDNDDNIPVQRTIPQRPKPTSTPLSSTKLRPASDVLNRLRWDPSLDPGEYIIGYEDRFLGAKETSLEKWKTEQTDEEFIPQHRILYFKRRGGDDGSGEVVWERATRIDKVFGSGASSGA